MGFQDTSLVFSGHLRPLVKEVLYCYDKNQRFARKANGVSPTCNAKIIRMCILTLQLASCAKS